MLLIMKVNDSRLKSKINFYFAESLPENMLTSTKIASVDRRDHISEDYIFVASVDIFSLNFYQG